MNWPRKVTPAVITLSRLLGLSSGLVINRIGPSGSGSLASRMPPSLPVSFIALRTDDDVGLGNAGRLNIRLKRGSGAAVTTGPSTSAACASTSLRITAPAAAAPTLPTNLRRLSLALRPAGWFELAIIGSQRVKDALRAFYFLSLA